MKLHCSAVVLAFIGCASTSVAAGVDRTEKRILTAEAYPRWRDVAAPLLSDDGQWVAYTLSHADGFQELIVRSTSDGKELRVARGALPRGHDWEDDTAWLELTFRPTQFSSDSRYLIFAIAPPVNEVSQELGYSPGDPDVIRDLGILHLQDGRLVKIRKVAHYYLPERSGRYLVYSLQSTKLDAAQPASRANKFTQFHEHQDKSSDKPRVLVLRDLLTESEIQVPNVTEFVIDDQARYLLYAVSSDQGKKSGVYVRRLADGQVVCLLRGPGEYRNLAFDATASQVAFLSDREGHGTARPLYSLYYAPSPLTEAESIVRASALPQTQTIDAGADPRFVHGGASVVFALKPSKSKSSQSPQITNQQIQRTGLVLHHWEAPNEVLPNRSSTYAALYSVKARKWVQLETKSVPRVLISEDQSLKYAIGVDESPYRLQSNWDWRRFDLYFVNMSSGIAIPIRQRLQASYISTWSSHRRVSSAALNRLSPSGRFLLYFEDRRWWSLDLKTGRFTDLTGSMPPGLRFDADDYYPAALPVAAWTTADTRVLLYDRRDIWDIDPTGATAPSNLTDGVGLQENLVFRLWENAYAPESDPIVDANEPLILIAKNSTTMATGIWRDWLGASRQPERLLMLEKRITPIAKARNTQQFLLSVETFSEYPDLWTGSRFDRLMKISNANPQQREYRWGSAELMQFVNDFGVSLKARLYKPEDFDSSKKYPLIVTFYEISSDQLHGYSGPAPLSTAPTASGAWPVATSNGYLFLIADVQMSVPYPFQSAIASIVPAVRAVVDGGFVDTDRIGLAGHSFGGYAVGALISHTQLFRCAVSSGSSFNTLADYGYPGAVPRERYFEIGQGRHGGSIWDRPFVYISNSPLLYVHRVQTPLLHMHNELDHATPLSQGMAFFYALQRNGKSAWVIRYQRESHVLESYVNRLDWDRRTIEFFDHYLKDKARPLWMRPMFGVRSMASDMHHR